MMQTKCRSPCTIHKTSSNCNKDDKCFYTDGEKFKFCRLSSKYEMKKPKCNITKKYLKKDKDVAAKRIQTFFRKTQRNKNKPALKSLDELYKPTTEFNPEIKEFHNKVQSRRIARFMRAVAPKRRAVFLNTVCSDSSVCMAFGKEDKKIKQFFDGFVKFDCVKSMRRIGAVSANGFVKELTYDKEGYKSYAVLKSSSGPKGDNLYYEYIVGKFINKLMSIVPSFVETYGVYKYMNIKAYTKMQELDASKELLDELVLLDTPNQYQTKTTSFINNKEIMKLRTACKKSQYIATLIEHIKDANTLREKCLLKQFVKNDLLYVLFTVYYTLNRYANIFTHYDLHLNNILLYEPVKDGYIQYHYHLPGGTVLSFASSYIAKIIDYGRSFFSDNSLDYIRIDSHPGNIYDKICNLEECSKKPKKSDITKRCGEEQGFQWLQPGKNISSVQRNVSADLRLLYMLHSSYKDFGDKYEHVCENVKEQNPEIYELSKKVVYKTTYSTPENPKNIYPSIDNDYEVNNITDAYYYLLDLALNPSNIANNSLEYSSLKKLGDMHIYGYQPMTYESV